MVITHRLHIGSFLGLPSKYETLRGTTTERLGMLAIIKNNQSSAMREIDPGISEENSTPLI